MHRILSLIAALLLAGITMAETLLTEDFTPAIGTYVTDSSEWYLEYGGTSGFSLTNGLSFPGYAGCGVGNALLLDHSGSSDQPHHAFAEQTSGNVYVAMMLQPTIVNKRGWLFALRDNQVGDYTNFHYNGRIFVNTDYHLELTFANNQSATADNSVTLDPQRVYLLVLRYAIAPGANNDTVSLYLFADDEPFPATEPATPLIGPLTDASSADINPANAVFRGFDNNGWLVVDGIRVATTFQEAALAGAGNCSSDDADDQDALENVPSAESATEMIYREGTLLIRRGNHLFSPSGTRIE